MHANSLTNAYYVGDDATEIYIGHDTNIVYEVEYSSIIMIYFVVFFFL